MQNGPMTGFVAAVFALVAAGSAPAQQAGKPDGNVEFVVGAGAGGEIDRIARAIQHVLTNGRLVESMTVLNKPGAAQTIAIGYLAGKKGDANEIGLASGSFINAVARNGSTLQKNITPVCTENLIRIDCVTESPNVSGDDRAALLLPDPVRLAVQVEEPT